MPRRLPALALLALAASAAGCSVPSVLLTPVDSSPELREVVVDAGETRRSKVAVIPVEGMLLNARSGGGILGAGENNVSLFRQQLDLAAADDRVKAVVLRVNSPGGTVTASEAMYGMVLDFRRRTGKPVVAACQDVAASGGYMVALAADEVHAAPTSIVGSIGVIFNTFDVSPLLAKIGVRVNPVTSGPLKDMASPFDGLDGEELAVIEGMVDELYAGFVAAVDERRGGRVDASVAYDGRVFTGVGAAQVGLVDRVAPLDESIARARQLAGDAGSRVVMYHRPYGYQGSIYASNAAVQPGEAAGGPAGALALRVPAIERLTELLQPGAYFLWMP